MHILFIDFLAGVLKVFSSHLSNFYFYIFRQSDTRSSFPDRVSESRILDSLLLLRAGFPTLLRPHQLHPTRDCAPRLGRLHVMTVTGDHRLRLVRQVWRIELGEELANLDTLHSNLPHPQTRSNASQIRQHRLFHVPSLRVDRPTWLIIYPA